MLTSDELQKLAKKAEERAKQIRRFNYINEHAPKPPILSSRYEYWLYVIILVGGCLAGFFIWRDQNQVVSACALFAVLALKLFVSWKRKMYQEKIRKVEVDFNDLLSKENFKLRNTDWE